MAAASGGRGAAARKRARHGELWQGAGQQDADGHADARLASASADLCRASLEGLVNDAHVLPKLLSLDPGDVAPLLIGCGNATVDVTCEVSRADLARLGLRPGMEAAGLPDTTKAAIVDFCTAAAGAAMAAPGGAAMNTTRVAAWSAGAGLRTAFIGAVGRDAHGDVLRAALIEAVVIPLLQQASPDQKTGVCAVLVERETRDRTLSTVRGAAGALDVAFLEELEVAALVDEASLLYLTSFVLTTQPRLGAAEALAERVCGRAAGAGALAINLSSSGVLGKVREPLLRLLPRARYAFGNEGELRAFGALLGWPEVDGDIRAAVSRLADLLAEGGVAVITAGGEPTLTAEHGSGRTQSFTVPALAKCEIEDTNGAGDTFVGGFLARAVASIGGRGAAPSLGECVEHGHRCAALILRRRGCDLRGLCPPAASVIGPECAATSEL